MATIRLVPSTYYLSNTQYLSVSSADSMYDNTDSTTYATVTNSQSGTTSYYLYLRGFNFDSVPTNAVVSGIAIKLKARESGVSTSSSYAPKLCNGTSQLTSTFSAITTTETVITASGYSLDFDTIKGYGSNFGIRINCRRASRNTTGYVYVYGAEIEVTYTLPNPRTITTTLSGNGTISPSGSNTCYDDDEFELTITPSNMSDSVKVLHNGQDVSNQLVGHGADASASTNLGTYTLVSGSFNSSGGTYFSGLTGKGVDGSQTTSNYYSSNSSTRAIFTYDMGFTLPSNATVTRVWCEVNGHAESTSQSNEYMCVQLFTGSTALSDEINFKSISTSNTTVTLECETPPTVSQIANMKLQCTLGYYGGAINGATCYVEYTTGAPTHYTYTFTVSGNATIAVTIGASNKLYIKINNAWKEVEKAYKKVNGVWVEQSDLTQVFQAGVNYRHGNS